MSDPKPRVEILQTEARSLFSRQVGREYQLAVWLPESYAASTQQYPVLYVLDGDLTFGMATTLIPLMNWTDQLPELIIVGIGYNRSFAEWDVLREQDFKLPAVQPDPPDSHADRFLAALQAEILPFVEQNYRADPRERILYGYSSSGFFTLYALAHAPGLFRHSLAGSPDTDLSYPYLRAHDQTLLAHDPASPISLFLTIGELEDGAAQSTLANFQLLAAQIQQKNYPGLRLMTKIYAGENHGAAGAALTLINGLRALFTAPA